MSGIKQRLEITPDHRVSSRPSAVNPHVTSRKHVGPRESTRVFKGALCRNQHPALDDPKSSLRYEVNGRCVQCTSEGNAKQHVTTNPQMLANLKLPEHPIHQRAREREWRRQGILYGDQALTWDIYLGVRGIQDGRCAICGRWFALFLKGAEAADHAHENEQDGSGQFRGVICSKKNGCNMLLGRFERGQMNKLTPEFQKAARVYLDDPPAARYRRSLEVAGALSHGSD